MLKDILLTAILLFYFIIFYFFMHLSWTKGNLPLFLTHEHYEYFWGVFLEMTLLQVLGDAVRRVHVSGDEMLYRTICFCPFLNSLRLHYMVTFIFKRISKVV